MRIVTDMQMTNLLLLLCTASADDQNKPAGQVAPQTLLENLFENQELGGGGSCFRIIFGSKTIVCGRKTTYNNPGGLIIWFHEHTSPILTQFFCKVSETPQIRKSIVQKAWHFKDLTINTEIRGRRKTT